ncbi:hypothetical protein HYD53_00845 [Mycoplasmopsis bovis]|nr:hypothetical protein [Mycoplasmopsis bovis]QQH72009.1 hypothetical protein HYD53_00845 [Mycoplasmopsis bovis]
MLNIQDEENEKDSMAFTIFDSSKGLERLNLCCLDWSISDIYKWRFEQYKY